ncbi:DUF2599 domain-containing protein [Phytoactinopolyspora alkaliphila]|uniref:DUF2599 domain-containing protein n=2 Tax=Phytoactinopolyspora alkaliphila TaxID=1783498 RepID=A0A6N9YJ44_9ACTN|nr:DUF2599 domain-containing protein [Phytoactinopolyspora alkaliphila]
MSIATAGAALVVAVSATAAGAAMGPFSRPDTSVPDAHVIAVRVTAWPGGSPVEAERPAAGGRYVENVEWVPDPHGRRLAVYPTDHGRYQAPAGEWEAAWAEVTALEPDADHPHMRDQFRCHVDFARIAEPDKPSWNLEMWRDDVGYFPTVMAGCNP